MVLPDPVLACKLLHCASLNQKERQLILAATPDLKYATMCSTLRRVFGESHVKVGYSGPSLVKKESVFTASETAVEEVAFYPKRGRGFTRGNRYRRSGSHRPYSLPQGRKSQQGRNPLDSNGRISTCSVCGSRNHWVRNCPDRQDYGDANKNTDLSNGGQKEDEEVVFLTFATISETLLSQCFGKAILDTA